MGKGLRRHAWQQYRGHHFFDHYSGELDVYGLLGVAPQVATPTFSPAGGNYTSVVSVTISGLNRRAMIYYTTNNTTPTTASTLYTGPVSVTASQTIQAFAVASGFSQSAVASSTYTIAPLGPAPTLTSASPSTGMQAQLNLPVRSNRHQFPARTGLQLRR